MLNTINKDYYCEKHSSIHNILLINLIRQCRLTIILIAVLLGTLFLSSCARKKTNDRQTIIVSIAPIKYLVENIVGDDFEIEVLVPEGSSPETYSPTPQQIERVENATILFITGLIDFETQLISKLSNSLEHNNVNVVILSETMNLLHGDDAHEKELHPNNGNHHHHSIDPHIWTSPKLLKVMAINIYNAIKYIIDDHGKNAEYSANFQELQDKIDALSKSIATLLKDSGTQKFIIYHPALAYYADDYELEQISIEEDGKEPSVIHIESIIAAAKQAGIGRILYQKEFSRSVVESVAKEIGADVVEINPLSENILEETMRITNVICMNNQAIAIQL